MTNPQATNSPNKRVRRRARPAAGAASWLAGGAEQSVFERTPAPDSIRGGDRFALGKHVKNRFLPRAGQRFCCKARRCRISGAGVFSSVAERKLGPPQ